MQQGYRQDQGQQRGAAPLARREHGAIRRFQGSFASAEADARMAEAARMKFNLVAPATSVGQIPDGTSVAISEVTIDMRPMSKGGDVYKIGDNYGLAKPALDKIAGALGISWDPVQSRRLDDGSHPHYAHFKAVGRFHHFDGRVQTIVGEKELDLRDGSAMVAKLQRDAKTENNFRRQLVDMRAYILGHAETKARLRAIRSTGVKTSYPEDDLRKPFVVARLMFTGHSADPHLREIGFRGVMDSMLGGTASLYGGVTQAPVYLPAMPAAHVHAALAQGHGPPPVGAVADDETIEDGTAATPPAPARPGDPTKVFMPGKGRKPVAQATDEDLDYWTKRMTEDRDAGKWSAEWAEKNAIQLATIEAELRRRRGEVEPELEVAVGSSPGQAAAAEEQPDGDDGYGDRDPDQM